MSKHGIEFISMAEVIEIHHNQILLYGGDPGIRDITLLSSALAMPEAAFDGEYLHHDLFEMAATYGFHICQNHPFVDGNKRVGLATVLIFLEFNGVEVDDVNDELYDMMMGMSKGERGKKDFASLLKKIST